MAGIQELKEVARAAFNEGRLEEATAAYRQLVALEPSNVSALCNYAGVAVKCGEPQEALQAAEQALCLLGSPGVLLPGSGLLLAKALHRKAQALVALGSVVAAVRLCRQGLAACGACPEAQELLLAALRLAADHLPPCYLAKYWARLVEEAQAPNPFSSRDGRLLKLIPPERRLSPEALQATLEEVMLELQDEARDLMCSAWAQRKKPGRAEAAFFRAAAYLAGGCPEFALRDVKVALCYGPQARAAGHAGDSSNEGKALVSSRGAGQEAPTAGPAPPPQVPCWPAALALQGRVFQALENNVDAALSMCKALELEPENESYSEVLATLLRRISEEYARALQERGSAGLEALQAAEREQALPEFLRQRPKYYYYYEWMRKRITQQYPALPEPVMDKLLTLEATELDLILQYPAATQQTVERLLGVYQGQGEGALESYRVPLLSWEEVKALEGPDTLGLLLGSEAYGGMLEALGMGGEQKPNPAPALAPASDPGAQRLAGSGLAGEALGVVGALEEGVATGAAIPSAGLGDSSVCAGLAVARAAADGGGAMLRSHRLEDLLGEVEGSGGSSMGSASVQETEEDDDEDADCGDLFELD